MDVVIHSLTTWVTKELLGVGCGVWGPQTFTFARTAMPDYTLDGNGPVRIVLQQLLHTLVAMKCNDRVTDHDGTKHTHTK